MRTIRPAHGSELLNASASFGVATTSTPGWRIRAPGAKSFAAAALRFAFSAALHCRTIAGGEGGGAATIDGLYD